jgi:hypothetical protein
MYSTPYVLLYNFRSESLLAGQSSFLANDNSGDSGNGAHTETSLHLRRQRYGVN